MFHSLFQFDLGFTKIALADFSSIPFFNLLILVANKSSPTICIFVFFVNFFQESHSSS